jgi:hypothetical protein
MKGFHLSWHGLDYNGRGIVWGLVAILGGLVVALMLGAVTLIVALINRDRRPEDPP